MPVAAVGAAVTVGTGLVKANAAKVAANKAADAQQHALDAQKPADINAISDQAKQADLKRYQDQFKALNEVDPVTGQIRTATNNALLAGANGDANGSNANTILQGLFDTNNPVNPADASFAADLKAKAQQQLDLGGKLSPEAQAEFVRAGLENASSSGFNAGSSATKQGIGSLLFSQSNALEQQRNATAQQLFGFATDLNTTRNQQLLGIANTATTKSAIDQQKLLALAGLTDSRTPSIGLTGGDVANLATGNANQTNAIALQKGAIQAQQAGANGQIISGLVGNLASAAGPATSAVTNYLKKPAAQPFTPLNSAYD